MNEIEKRCICNAIDYILNNNTNINHNKSLYESLMLIHNNNIYKIDSIILNKLENLYGS